MGPAPLVLRQDAPTIPQLAGYRYCFLAVPVIALPASVAINRNSLKSSPAEPKKLTARFP
jgi:hypothetical protein